MNSPFLVAWVASIPGVGPKRFESLCKRLPDLGQLLTMSHDDLIKNGIPEKLVASILSHREKHSPKEIEEFCQKHSIQLITQESSLYPPLLAQISDPPIVLYVKGELPIQTLATIAVVGTRNNTSYGQRVTTELTRGLVQAGFVIVSGFMYGIDAIAHTACVDVGGKTIAVLGYGLGVPFFPRSHDALAQKVLDAGGVLLTEFPPWQHAVPGNFPSRNRIVSGVSLGVLVIEAASKSGSRITAGLAVDQGREVFAVPGPINSAFSEGTKDLVNLGAKLVSSASDIVEELGQKVQASAKSVKDRKRVPTFTNALEQMLYTYIEENTEATLEDLITTSTASAQSLGQALASLELSGVIYQPTLGVFSIRLD